VTVLDETEQLKITRNIKNFMNKYANDDKIRKKRMDMAANKEKIEILASYRHMVAERMVAYERLNAERKQLGLVEEEKEGGFEWLDEVEEQVISEKVEPF